MALFSWCGELKSGQFCIRKYQEYSIATGICHKLGATKTYKLTLGTINLVELTFFRGGMLKHI